MPETTDPATLPAGPDLDALIAEKVMGLDVVGEGLCTFADGEGTFQPDTQPGEWNVPTEVRPLYVRSCVCDLAEPGDERPRHFGHDLNCLEPVLFYSTDIAAAWMVVERMREGGLLVLLETRAETFIVGIRSGPYGPGVSRSISRTAPLAICRAALAAMGGVK